jgi:hypothetical protein
LCISGQIPSNLIGRGFGLLHEVPDQLAILRGLTKWAARIDHPSETGKRVNEAFRQLADGRPRPVALEMPLDIMALETELALPDPEPALPAPSPDGELIAQAAKLLAAAKQPLIYIGSGPPRRAPRCWPWPSGCRRRSPPIPAAKASSATATTWRRTCWPGMSCGALPMSCWRSARASTSRRRAGVSMARSR